MLRSSLIGVIVVIAACSSRPALPPAPSDPTTALAEFMEAVKRNDLDAMGALWGTRAGPAAAKMNRDEMRKRVQTIQIYLSHTSYRVMGPATPEQAGDRQAFQVSLHRTNGCRVEFPIELVRTPRREWLVADVNLEQAGNPARGCRGP